MKRAAVFMENYGLGRCSVALCLLDMLSENYQVDLFVANVWLGRSPVLSKRSVRILNINDVESGYGLRLTDWLNALLAPRLIRSLVDHARAAIPRLRRQYEIYLSFDPRGFVRCLSLFPNATPIYVSLELYFRDNCFNLAYPDDIMQREREAINTMNGLVIQSPEREQLFRAEYGLDPRIPTFLLPVTQLEAAERAKSDYLCRNYRISADSKLLLHLGGIAPHHCCVEMVEAFMRTRGWVLVFHGHAYSGYVDTLRRRIKDLVMDDRVVITTGYLDDFNDVDDILASAHVGICWYDNVSPNFTSAGMSSGKTSAYLRFGLPVITNGYQSSRMAIETTGCGVCIDQLSGLADALRQIELNYERLSRSAFEEYERTYWFEKYRRDVARFVGALKTPSGDGLSARGTSCRR